MTGLFGQVATLLGGGFLPPKGQIKRTAIGMAVAVLALLTAYCFGMFAIWRWVADTYGPAVAGAIMAAAMIVVAAFAWALTAFLNYRGRRRAKLERQAQTRALERTLTEAAVLSVPGMMRKKPIVMMFVAAGMGYIVTRMGSRRN